MGDVVEHRVNAKVGAGCPFGGLAPEPEGSSILENVYAILGLLTFAVVLFALIDIITRDPWQVRHLPKVTWVILVIFLPLIGSIIWFAVGREWGRPADAVPFGHPSRHEAAASRVMIGSQTEAELAALDAEIAAAERDEHIRRLEAEIEARRAARDGRG